MRKIFFIAFLFIGTASFGQVVVQNNKGNGTTIGCNWPKEESFGTFYQKSTWTNLFDFVLNGGLTAVIDSGGIDFTPSSNGTFTNFATIGFPSTLANRTLVAKWKATSAAGGTTYGVGGGLYSANTASGTSSLYDALGRVDMTTGGSAGQVIMNTSQTVSLATSGASVISYSKNDMIQETFVYSDTTVTATFQNITTAGTAVSLTYNFTSSTATTNAPNTSYFALYFFSSARLVSLTLSSPDIKNPTVMIDGDSKTKGYFCTHWNDRLSYLLNANFGTTTIYAGGYDRVAEHLYQALNDDIGMDGKYVIMNIGSNGLRAGTALATVERQYDSLVNYHLSTGATVLHMVLPEDSTAGGIGLTAFKNYVATKYAAFYIDAWDSLSTYSAGSSNNVLKSIYTTTGGVHPNSLANAKEYQAVIASGLLNTCPTASRSGQGKSSSAWNVVVARDTSYTHPFYSARIDSIANHATAATPTFDQVIASGNSTTGYLRITGVTGSIPASGAGIEFYYNSGGFLNVYDRGLSQYKPFFIQPAGDGSALTSIGTSTTPTAILTLGASVSGHASLRILTGVVPSSPNAGDVYQDGTHLYIYLAGSWHTII